MASPECTAGSQDSKVGGNNGQEEAAILAEPCHAAPVTVQKFLEMKCCLASVLRRSNNTLWQLCDTPPTNSYEN